MRRAIFLTLATAGLVGCTQGDVIQVGDTRDVEIRIRSVHQTITATGQTRVPFIGSIAEANPLTAQVFATKTTGDYVGAGFHVSGDMTFVGGSAPSSYNSSTWTNPSLAKFPFPGGDTPLYLAGLHPVAGWTLADAATVASYTFNGSQDLMHAAEVTTSENAVRGGSYQSLVFRHLLTKLEITLKARTNAAAGAWGKITKIELLKVSAADPINSIDVNLKSGVAALGTTTSIVPTYKMSVTGGAVSYIDDVFSYVSPDGVTLTESGETLAYSLIQPLATGADDDLTFRVHKASGGYTDVDVKLPTVTNSAGRSFGITFVFNADASSIQAMATVIDWIDGGDVEKEVS